MRSQAKDGQARSRIKDDNAKAEVQVFYDNADSRVKDDKVEFSGAVVAWYKRFKAELQASNSVNTVTPSFKTSIKTSKSGTGGSRQPAKSLEDYLSSSPR